jgi:mannosylglycerate hydrolase
MKPYRLHIISHTHWDREWYLNSPYVNEWLAPFFDSLFSMMEREPDYRFVLDGQASMIDDWFDELDRRGRDRAAELARLRTYAGQGRILVGPYYLQLDWNLASPETLVRNLLVGMEAVSAYGPPMKVGWLLDNFGQTGQTAQIHAGFGIDSIFMWRGAEVDSRSLATEFWWESPDGTKSLTVLLLGSYRNAMRLGAYPDVAARRLLWEKRKLSAFTTTPNAVLMNGYDQETEPDDILRTLRACGPLPGIEAVQSTPAEYVAAVRDCAPELVTRSGSLYGGRYIAVFPGVLSARTYLKTRNDDVASLIERQAEPVAAFLTLMGAEPSGMAGLLARAWKELLRNQPHDSICGVSVDPVHADMEHRFDRVESLAREALALGAEGLYAAGAASGREPADADADADAGKRPAFGDCPTWVLFNPLPRARSLVVDLELPAGFDRGNCAVYDDSGTALACEPGSGKAMRVFMPHLAGFSAHGLCVRTGATPAPRGEAGFVYSDAAAMVMGNGRFRVKVNADGTFDLHDAGEEAVYRGLGYFVDEGDAGDEYDYSPCAAQKCLDSRTVLHEIEFEEQGKLRSVIRISCVMRLPASLDPDRKSRSADLVDLPLVLRLSAEAGAPSLGISVECRNAARDHRLRMHFPSGRKGCRTLVGSAFAREEMVVAPADYSESDLSREAAAIVIGARAAKPVGMRPMRDFATLETEAGRLEIFADGLHEAEALESGGIAVTLLRGMDWLARADLISRIGDAGPLMRTPEAQCLRDMSFRLGAALRPGTGPQAPVDALQERRWKPVVIANFAEDSGALGAPLSPSPRTQGALELVRGGDRLFISAVKPAADGSGIALRLWNPESVGIEASLRVPETTGQVWLSSLAEGPGDTLAENPPGIVPFTVPAGKIVTLRIAAKVETCCLPMSGAADAAKNISESADSRKVRVLSTGIPPASDFSHWILPEAVGEDDYRKELLRADAVEAEWKTAFAACESARAARGDTLKIRKLALAEASIRRTSIEARISAVLLARHALPDWNEEAERGELRKLGYALNLARIDKRALEYVVECLENTEAITESPDSTGGV